MIWSELMSALGQKRSFEHVVIAPQNGGHQLKQPSLRLEFR